MRALSAKVRQLGLNKARVLHYQLLHRNQFTHTSKNPGFWQEAVYDMNQPLMYGINADHEVYPIYDINEQVTAWRNDEDLWRVGSDHIGKIWVSTVFLGIDHSLFEASGPVLFETMVFPEQAGPGLEEEFMLRYRTWDEAEIGHYAVVSGLKNGLSYSTIEAVIREALADED